MAFSLIQLVILCFVGCNAGVVPQHFISDHTEPVNVEIEKVPNNFVKNKSNSSLGILQTEISNSAVEDDDHHHSSEVPIIGFHNTSEELNITKHNVSEESRLIVNNHSKEFDHSHRGDTKGSGRSRKKSSKGSNRFKKNTSKETKNVEEVTKGHFNNNSLNESQLLEDFMKESSHPVKEFSKLSDHAENHMEDHFKDSSRSHHTENFVNSSNHFDNVSEVTDHDENIAKINFNQHGINGSDQANEKDFEHFKHSSNGSHVDEKDFEHFKDSLNGSNHAQNIVKGFNHFDKNVSEVTDHVENITKIDFNQHGINGSDHADGIVADFDHSNHVFNESHHQKDVLNNSHSEQFLDFDNMTEPVHQVEQIASEHFENVSETGNDSLRDFDTLKDFQMKNHFDSTSATSDETKSLSNSFKISDDHIALKELHHADNTSDDINNFHHDPSNINSFHEDNIHKIGVETHSNEPASDMHPLIRHESSNSSEIILNDTERSSGIDIHLTSAKENSSLDLFQLHKDSEDNSTLMNHHFNETNSNDAYVMFTVSPKDETNSSTELSHEFLRDLEKSTNEAKLNPETNDPNKMVAEENATQGLFSGIGLDFLFNSELAKNAASAMDVFNFTDSALTDHIVDEKNDVHDFLDLIHPPVESDNSDSKDESDSKNEFHGSITMQDNLNETEMNQGLNLTSGVTATVHPQTSLNATDVFEETTTLLSSTSLNSTVFKEPTMVSQPMLNSTVEFEETTTIVSHSVINSTVVHVICPPPGMCIFWFLAQDTCAVNSHCLGSRICCRIGCAKTCIEV